MVLSTMYTPSGVAAADVVTGAAALVFSGLDAVIGDPIPDAGTPIPADPPHAPTASSKPTTSGGTDLSVTSLTPCVGFALPKPPHPNSPNMRCCGERVIAMTNTFSKRDPKAPPPFGPRVKRPSAAEWTGSANPGETPLARRNQQWQRTNRRIIRIQGQRSARSREPFGLYATIRVWLCVRHDLLRWFGMTPRSKVLAASDVGDCLRLGLASVSICPRWCRYFPGAASTWPAWTWPSSWAMTLAFWWGLSLGSSFRATDLVKGHSPVFAPSARYSVARDTPRAWAMVGADSPAARMRRASDRKRGIYVRTLRESIDTSTSDPPGGVRSRSRL